MTNERLRVRLDELLPAKTAARELPRQLRRLESGEVEQLVITARNEPRAVLITVERYEQLLGRQEGTTPCGHVGRGCTADECRSM